MALRRLEIEESRHIANYGSQLKDLGDDGSIDILNHVIEDENDHHRELGSLLRGHYAPPASAPKVDPKAVLDELLAKRNEGRKQAGSWIGDAIYGVNDGLGAIFGIVSGVSGATAGESQVRAAGRPLGHDRQRAVHGLRRLSRRQERAGDLSRRTGARARSHQDEPRRSPRTARALLPGQRPAGRGRLPRCRPHRHAIPTRCCARWQASGSAPRRRRCRTPWSRPPRARFRRPSAP